jgi:hypothetical protein
MPKLKRAILSFDAATSAYGLSLVQLIAQLRWLPEYRRDLSDFKRLSGDRTDWPITRLLPKLNDRRGRAGTADGHFFHQDLWAATRICSNNPRRHIDVGSRIDGFVAHVASFREIEIFDLRPLAWNAPNIKFTQLDLMQPIPSDLYRSCDSLSSLHVLEHFGLGRYGDRIDPDAYRTGFSNMVEMLEPGGVFYFSVRIGHQCIKFNAHRIFSLDHLFELFGNSNLNLVEFAYVDDDGNLHRQVPISEETAKIVNGLTRGCGLFELHKTV